MATDSGTAVIWRCEGSPSHTFEKLEREEHAYEKKREDDNEYSQLQSGIDFLDPEELAELQGGFCPRSHNLDLSDA